MGMKDLTLLLASAMSKDELLSQLKTAISKYEQGSVTEKDSLYEHIELSCLMLCTKRIVPTMESAVKVSKEMEAQERMMNLFTGKNTEKN